LQISVDSDVDVETLQDDGNKEEKSRLLEDLLMSDGEMSGDEDSDDHNPFAQRKCDVTMLLDFYNFF